MRVVEECQFLVPLCRGRGRAIGTLTARRRLSDRPKPLTHSS